MSAQWLPNMRPSAHRHGSAFLQGLIFCVATDSGVLKLYDIRSYEKGPFDTFTVRVWSPTAVHLLHRPDPAVHCWSAWMCLHQYKSVNNGEVK